MTISNLTTTSSASGEITLGWADSGRAIEIVVMWRPSGTVEWNALGLPKTTTGHTISGLTPGQSYDVRVLQDGSDRNAHVLVPSPVVLAPPGRPGVPGQPLQVGEYWQGNSVADYPLKLQQDPSRSFDTTVGGLPAIGMKLDNADLVAAANPRNQLQGPQTLFTAGGVYTAGFEVQVPTGALVFTSAGWCVLWQEQGHPFAGSPPMSIATRDGINWGFWEDGTPADGQKWSEKVLEPIAFDTFAAWEFDFTYSTGPASLSIKYQGAQVFQTPTFAAVDATNLSGPSFMCLDLYAKRGSFSQIGPVTFRNHYLARVA